MTSPGMRAYGSLAAMQAVTLHEGFFSGALSVERLDGALRPWRLPHDRLELYPSPEESLIGRAMESSGLRLRFATDAPEISVRFRPLRGEPLQAGHSLDVTVDGELAGSVEVAPGATSATFSGLPAAAKVVEVWLPHTSPIEVTGLTVDCGLFLRAGSRPAPEVDHLRQLAHALPPRAQSGAHLAGDRGPAAALAPDVARVRRQLLPGADARHRHSRPAGGLHLAQAGHQLHQQRCAVRAHLQGRGDRPGADHPRTPSRHPAGADLADRLPAARDQAQPGGVHDRRHARRTSRTPATACRGAATAICTIATASELFSVDEIAQYAEDQCHPDADGIELMAEHFLHRVADRIPLP